MLYYSALAAYCMQRCNCPHPFPGFPGHPSKLCLMYLRPKCYITCRHQQQQPRRRESSTHTKEELGILRWHSSRRRSTFDTLTKVTIEAFSPCIHKVGAFPSTCCSCSQLSCLETHRNSSSKRLELWQAIHPHARLSIPGNNPRAFRRSAGR